jgi:hypothetical protein
VSIALAYFWLHEKLSSTPAAVAGEVVALVVMTGGIVVLAHRAPIVTRQLDKANARGGRTAGNRGTSQQGGYEELGIKAQSVLITSDDWHLVGSPKLAGWPNPWNCPDQHGCCEPRRGA